MAVTTCPDCGREVSTLAEACPQCGHPFTPQQAETLKTEVSRSAVASLVFSLLWLGGIGSILVPHVGSARRWAESAVEYAEALDRRSDDREEAISSLLALGLSVCRQLVAYESDNVGGSPRSPAQVEADMRDTLGLEGWELLGPVWYESLVYGLCVR
jgi:hypothetical protein